MGKVEHLKEPFISCGGKEERRDLAHRMGKCTGGHEMAFQVQEDN
jgi:hypothetical protein